MPDRLPRYSTLLRLLRWSLVLGAAYDAVFAVLFVVAPELPQRWTGLPMPGESFYLWLIAVFLGMLAAFYLLAAYDPVSYQGNVAVAVVGRAAGALALGWAAVGRPDLAGLWLLAAGDGLFAVLHAGFGWPVRRR